MKTLIAHRGMSTLAPENTLAAFALCPEYGIKWVECDLDMLADGTVVLSHDNTLDRCTDRSGSLFDLSYEDLQDIDAGSWFSDAYIGERIPTLEKFIELVNIHGLNANIEIKSSAESWAQTERLIENVANQIKKVNENSQILISSFNHLLLREFKQLSPDTAIACLFDKHALENDWFASMQACLAEAIHVEDEGLTQAQIINFKRYGYEINVYTVNNLARANQLFNWGVDGIFTDIGQKFPLRYRNLAF